MDKEKVKEEVLKLRHKIWGKDIPSPTCPEYVELHEAMVLFMKMIDENILPLLED